jgi:hypothetical protein
MADEFGVPGLESSATLAVHFKMDERAILSMMDCEQIEFVEIGGARYAFRQDVDICQRHLFHELFTRPALARELTRIKEWVEIMADPNALNAKLKEIGETL